MAVKKPMPREVRRAYLSPYNNWANRISTLRFVQDIPLSAADPAWASVAGLGAALAQFADRPALLCWASSVVLGHGRFRVRPHLSA